MSFGTDLAKEFYTLTNNVMMDEVCLFTKLQDAFINLKSMEAYQYAINIIHGNKSFVDFKFNSPWTSKISYGEDITRELSDMMFIIYSPKQNQMRITYMQNKKGASADKFKADLGQLHLLSKREHITSDELPACLFNNPNILFDALLPSVGSYGIFYNDGHIVEMAYYPAYQIHPCRSTGASVIRMAKYNIHNLGKVTNTNGYAENQGTHKISDFGDALVNMQIGTPIKSDTNTHRELIMFLSNYDDSLKQTSWYNDYGNYIPIANNFTQTPSVPVMYAINTDRMEH